MPARYSANVNREAPFEAQRPGKPSLNDAEINDLVAFLHTLTDKDARTVRP